MGRQVFTPIIAFVVFLMIGSAGASAQQLTTATLSGSATDPQGAQIPGVSVVLKSETRGLALPVVVTDERGEFLIR